MEEFERSEGMEATMSTGREETLPTPVMGRLTIKEVEMVPRQEELAAMDRIEIGGTTQISEEVIGAIAGIATREVQGVAEVGSGSIRRTLVERVGGAERRSRGVVVEAGRREAILDIDMRVIYGYSIPNTVVKVRHNVTDRLLNLCGMVAKEVNVRVIGLEYPQQTARRVQ